MTAEEEAAKPEESAGAKKKAAKKAAAKAKKAAMKEAAATGGGPPADANNKAAANPNKGGGGPAARTVPVAESFQIVINPNQPMKERPVVALAAAVLTNTFSNYELVSDHRSKQTALGLPNGGAVVGDFAIARYVVSTAKQPSTLFPESKEEAAVVDAWINYAQSLQLLDIDKRAKAIASTLTKSLDNATYAAGYTLTIADLALYAVLGCPAAVDSEDVEQYFPPEATPAKRWLRMMKNSLPVKEAFQMAMGVAGGEAVFDDSGALEPLVSGMNLLEGAIPGRVVTRFPPEPSGYLHIGHAKAVLLNDYYARRYNGRLIVRFDDTNPSKEKEEYQQSIVQDLALLGVQPDLVTYTSDYFGAIYECAVSMIQQGLAYMDDTPQEQMKTERAERKDSARRAQSIEENMECFKLMCSGSEEGSKWCLRAKIAMQSDNGTMRDPVLFRQNTEPHHRTGTTYKAYPTYDLACPIVDSLEGVSHALRTTEYNDRDEQYRWIQNALNLRTTRIHAFSRVNFTNTVLSKRKLAWFVDNGYVTGWDDPRFPTVRGVVRRGIDTQALRGFMYAQGASRRVVNMVWHKFWAENKKEIDKRAKRFMAIDAEKHTILRITGGPKEEDFAFAETSVHPKDPSLGNRLIRLSDTVLLENADVEGVQVDETIVLLRWGVVKITKVGDELEEHDNLITKEKLEETDKFEDYINPNTEAVTEVVGDAALKSVLHNEIIQLERRGYYRVDRPYISRDKPLVLFMVPDGKSKAMSGLAGKLAHR
ncbi:Glutamine--tRNA ligase [Seminavis robusta]|uniref:glutamate--tRNA ligase n=1 Tax=Seminavis robusta TaxID=568900 RepID=A0A9N8DHU9_9STRA|nr:Glutamine--tRNA ligase [Seminavis robusta]|eukprot:Sro151_g069130.1 Glutamine--tRNA ligase (764) ;mRNA; r:40622-43278